MPASVIGKEEIELVDHWRGRIKLSELYREADGRKQSWENMKKYYMNKFAPEVISVNFIFSHGRQIIPFLYFVNPVIECTALQRGWERKGAILEAVDNMLIDKMRVKEQLKLIIQDAYLFDYGIRKVGYDAEFGYDPTGSLVRELMEELGVVMEEEKMAELNTFIIEETPYFLRVPPTRFLVDPDTEGPGLETSRWVIEEFYRPMDDVLADERYEIKEKDKLTATHRIQTFGAKVVISPVTYGNVQAGQAGVHSKSDLDRLHLYEVWDKVEKRVMVMAEGYPGFLREQQDEWNLPHFFPYDRLCFNPVSDEHYSVSDAMYIEKQQVELNDIRTQEMHHRRKENLKILTTKGLLSKEAISKMDKGTVGPIVETNSPPGQMGANVLAFAPNMSRDIFKAADDIRDDMREVLRLSRNQLSQELGRRKTATEASIIKQSVDIWTDERRDIVSDFLTRAMEDVNELIFKFWDTNDVIELTGPEGAEWKTWNGEFLKGRYALRIVTNSTLPMTKELYRRQIGELVQKYIGHPLINQRELIRLDLDSYEEFDTSRILLSQPNFNQPLDFRPGQTKVEGGGGSRINIPENPEVTEASTAGGEGGGL